MKKEEGEREIGKRRREEGREIWVGQRVAGERKKRDEEKEGRRNIYRRKEEK